MGDVGAVELDLEWTGSVLTLTTSQPSTDSEVDSEVDVEDESDDTALTSRGTAELIAVPGTEFERPWSRSFPLSEPKRRLTPKLSLRFRGLLEVSVMLLLSLPLSLPCGL